MFNIFKRLFKIYPIQTFTYFIPAPPERKQGYREKAFDGLIQKLTKMNFDIIDIKTQAINNNTKSGMWVITKLRPLTKEASRLRISEFPLDNYDNEEENGQLQNLAHFPLSNDNLNHQFDNNKSSKARELDTFKGNSIELPKIDEDEESDKIEGIYYID